MVRNTSHRKHFLQEIRTQMRSGFICSCIMYEWVSSPLLKNLEVSIKRNASLHYSIFHQHCLNACVPWGKYLESTFVYQPLPSLLAACLRQVYLVEGVAASQLFCWRPAGGENSSLLPALVAGLPAPFPTPCSGERWGKNGPFTPAECAAWLDDGVWEIRSWLEIQHLGLAGVGCGLLTGAWGKVMRVTEIHVCSDRHMNVSITVMMPLFGDWVSPIFYKNLRPIAWSSKVFLK